MHFADFKFSGLEYRKVPDVVGLSAIVQNGEELRLIGELKVPWVSPSHSLSRAYGSLKRLRRFLGQPVLYMGDIQCEFGFVSTYNETIFLRQSQLASGQSQIEYSPVTNSTDVYEPSGLSVSMRQYMFYVATLASSQGPVNNQTPAAQWVVSS